MASRAGAVSATLVSEELDRIVEELGESRLALLEIVRGLPIAERDRSRWYGDDGWTVKDILNHVAAWEERDARILEQYLDSGAPPRPAEDETAFNAATQQATWLRMSFTVQPDRKSTRLNS